MVVNDMYYWGTPDANKTWCEPLYAVSPYIAEFWNTLSSFCVLIAGLLAIRTIVNEKTEKRFIASCAIVSVVGLGSVFFHMTSRRWAQMLDEVPMLWQSLYAYFLAIDIGKKRYRNSFIAIQVVGDLLFTMLYAFVSFSVFLAVFTFFSMSNTYLWGMLAYNQKEWGFYKRYTIAYMVSFTCWNLDNEFCKQLGNLYLHAVWHIGCAYGVYYFLVLQHDVRKRVLNMNFGQEEKEKMG